jgi:hypothetical protein
VNRLVRGLVKDIKSNKPVRSRPVKVGLAPIFNEGTKKKHIPNGLRVLFVFICKFWILETDENPNLKERTVPEFASEILYVYNYNCKRYGRKTKRTPELLAAHITKIHNMGVEPTFIDMRTYADYIGVPVGVLLLISQMIGLDLDHKEHSKLKVFEFIEYIAKGASHITQFLSGEDRLIVLSQTNKTASINIQKIMKLLDNILEKNDRYEAKVRAKNQWRAQQSSPS